jgi:hypothetical protein
VSHRNGIPKHTEPAYSAVVRRDLGDAIRVQFAVSEPAPQSLTKLLEQLEARVKLDFERERLHAAVQQAVDVLTRPDPDRLTLAISLG